MPDLVISAIYGIVFMTGAIAIVLGTYFLARRILPAVLGGGRIGAQRREREKPKRNDKSKCLKHDAPHP